MAIIQFTGFESGADFYGDVSLVQGTASYVTSPVRSGTYALRTNPTTTGTGSVAIRGIASNGTIMQNTLQSTDTYIQFYLRIATLPASGYEQVCTVTQFGSSSPKGWLAINSSGNLSVYDKDFSKIGSDGATSLSLNTWYQIRFYIGNGTTAGYSVYINGVLELSGTGDFVAADSGDVIFGKSSDRSGQTVDYYFDDVVIDNAAFPSTDLKVNVLKPTANGSTMSWSNGTNTSDYTQVDEIPIDSTDYVQSPTTGNPNIALFTMQSMATVGFNGNVKAIKGVAFSRENTSVTSAVKIRVRSGGTDSDSSTFNGSNTTYNGQSRLLLTDPATSAAWTTSGVNAIEVGPVENNAVAQRCMSVLAMVLYEEISSYTITAACGSFSLSGQDANFLRNLIMSVAYGAFNLTGQAVGLTKNFFISLAAGLFTLTGVAVNLRKLWTNDSKPDALSYTNDSKPSNSFTNDSKPTSSWTNDQK